jgi:hypothetical protein
MGPMPWTINSEIYPQWARSTGNALATSTNWIFNLLIAMTFLSLMEAITKQGQAAFYLPKWASIDKRLLFRCLLPLRRPLVHRLNILLPIPSRDERQIAGAAGKPVRPTLVHETTRSPGLFRTGHSRQFDDARISVRTRSRS